MKKICGSIGALLALMFASPEAQAVPKKFSHGHYQNVEVWQPQGPDRGVVLLLTDSRGKGPDADTVAQALAADGRWVAVINTAALMTALKQEKDDCIALTGDLDNLGRHLQGWSHRAGFDPPILAGIGDGAALSYVAAAGAETDTFSAWLGIAPSADPPKALPLCDGPGVAVSRNAVEPFELDMPAAAWFDSGVPLDPFWPLLLGPWDAAGRVESPAPAQTAKAWQQTLKPVLAALPEAGPPQEVLDGLPLTEIPVPGAQHLVILLSGDGGWAGLARDLSAELTARGISVVGFDSLRYFWTRREPQGLADDLSKIIEHYAKRWDPQTIDLVGYSQGADVLPFAWPLLSEDARKHVAHLTGIALGRQAAFEFHVGQWLGVRGDYPIAPQLKPLSGTGFSCIYGDEDDDSICPDIDPKAYRVVKMAGGHHFNGNMTGLADAMLQQGADPAQNGQAAQTANNGKN